MKQKLVLLAIFGIMMSCEPPKSTKDIHANAEGEITVGQNFVVERPLAILINPTDEQLKVAKAEMGNDYNVFYGDGTKFMTQASKIMEENNIETIDRLSNEIITFHTKEGKLYDVNLIDKEFSLLLFNGKDEPKDIELEELSTDYIKKYMQ